MPYFSIILPTYNRAHLLPKAIESVLAQTFTDWELLIVDDGSTDTTKELVATFKDERIRYIFQENQERSAARNNGIKQSRGAYICFLDSDDYFLDKKLENLHKAQIGVENLSIWYDGLIIEQNNTKDQFPFPIKENDFNEYEFIISNILFSQQICANIELFKEFQFNPKIRIGEDMELWFRIASKHSFIPVKNSFQTVILEHDERSINIKKSNISQEQLKTIKFIFSSSNGNQIRGEIKKKIISNIQFNQAKHYMYNAKYSKGIIALVKSILTDIRNEQVKHRIYCLKSLLLHKIPHEYTLLN